MEERTRRSTNSLSAVFKRHFWFTCKTYTLARYLSLIIVEKPVMLSHYNIISGIIQTCTFDSVSRKADGIDMQVMLGVLPFSHVFGLMLITHLGTYRGDEIIVMPRFEFEPFLSAVSRFQIHQLPIVPPIVIQMLDRRELCRKYDLSSVRFVYTGAAPLGKETVDDLLSLYPNWRLGQGYGEIND